MSGNVGQPFAGGGLSLTGSGFAEGLTAVRFGASSLMDASRSTGPDIYYGYNPYPNYIQNAGISLTAPTGVPSGPIVVTTPGGSSAAFGLTFTGITATATAGTAANGGVASANPGQTITINGSGCDSSTDVVFRQLDYNGNPSEIIVHPVTVSGNGSSAQVVVPIMTITGTVRVIGDTSATEALLQIVPIVQSVDVTSVRVGWFERAGRSVWARLH